MSPKTSLAHDLDREAQAAARGDRQAFERFHRATVARVHTLARRLVGVSQADEATQEIYLRVWRGLPGWRGEARIGTWLHQLARNTLLGMLARAELVRVGDDERLVSETARGAEPALRLELEEAIQSLPHRARVVFVLHDVEGLRHEEIAEELAITVGTSKSQLHRARLLLRALWTGEAPKSAQGRNP
jgi:RNA polymerase sigma-70 factor (ECF subfamily)